MSEKVALEVAEVEFLRFADIWDIDADTEDMSEEDQGSFNQLKKRVIKRIMSGHASINDEGDLRYGLMYPKGELTSICFKIPTGHAYSAMSKYKEKQGIERLNAFMGDMTGLPPRFFVNIDSRDLHFCQAVAALFLG